MKEVLITDEKPLDQTSSGFPHRDTSFSVRALVIISPTDRPIRLNSLTMSLPTDLFVPYRLAYHRAGKQPRAISYYTRAITAIAFGAIQVHDLELRKKLVMTIPHLKPGDMLTEDRGFLDGKTISRLKKKRGVDTILPLLSNMQAYNDAIVSAYHHEDIPWERHPSRKNQEIKKIEYNDAPVG